jgi:release factor glutamine methyltransferase
MPELPPVLGTLIHDGTERLRRAGIAEPRRETIRIWADLTQAAPGDVLLQRDNPVTAVAADRFHGAITRRSRGEPLSHVTGWSGFRRISLRSDRRALIPRPETEGLVDLILERVRTGRVADVGTGSGCLALSLALEGSFAEVVGLDCSVEALELARLNRELVGAPVSFVQGDLCAPLRQEAFHALVSNPPYLTAAEYSELESSVRQWEPAMALVSGEDGMEATLRLLSEGRHVLRPGGWLALELDCTRAGLAACRARELGWHNVSVHVDLFGRERYLLAQRSVTL